MGTYNELGVGDVFATPTTTVSESDVDALVTVGGYTHPLFADAAFAAASAFGKRPLPGQAVLLLMGGLIEQSGRFDDTVVALIGLDNVRFAAAGFAGDTIGVEVEILSKTDVADGRRGVLRMRWTATNADGDELVSAEASMLFRRGTADEPLTATG